MSSSDMVKTMKFEKLAKKLQVLRQNHSGALDVMIIAMIALMVIIAVFLALWNPSTGDGLRDYLYDLINDSDFTTAYGTGLRDGIVKFLDVVPLIAGLIGITAVLVLIKTIMKNPKSALGL